jgi:alpha/beta superfamily hydrolase
MFGNVIGRLLASLEALLRSLSGNRGDVLEQEPALDPAPDTCPISWQPSVVAPVFYGTRDFTPNPPVLRRMRAPMALRPPIALRPPGTFRVFFPSIDGSRADARMLEPCGRYPLVMFLHGHCSEDRPLNHRKWYELPAQLARSGYVVVVPYLPATSGGTAPSTPGHPDIPLILRIMQWMRTDWDYARVLLPAPATAIVGHSFGALLGGRVALEQQGISAYVSLSGVWRLGADPPWSVHRLAIPKLFIWGDDDFQADIYPSQFWDPLPLPRHAAIFKGGGHWDYLPPGRTRCATSRGPCNLVGVVSADLVAAFLGKYLPPERWGLLTVIPDSLVATHELLSFEREFYAGNHLMGIRMLDHSPGGSCQVKFDWDTGFGSGEETHPPH